MPKSPQVMSRKAGVNLSDLRVFAEQRELELRSGPPRRPRKNSRMYTLITEIYNNFEPLISSPDPNKPVLALPAETFGYLENEYSSPTVIKAKKILGIDSRRTKKGWVWCIPRYAPDEAMQKLHDKQMESLNEPLEQMREHARPSAVALAEIMAEFNYDAAANDVIEALPFKRTTIVRMKSLLGIVSVKRANIWRWVYPSKEIQDWLLEQMNDGPVGLEHLFALARQREWSEDVVKFARLALGGIQSRIVDGKISWYTA